MSWAIQGTGVGKPRRPKKRPKPPEPKLDPSEVEPRATNCRSCGALLTEKNGRFEEFTKATGSKAWCSSACRDQNGGSLL